jgi:hypothetical protein
VLPPEPFLAIDLDWYLHGPAGTSRLELWRWWEERRLRFNRDLFLVGLCSCLLLIIGALGSTVEPGEDVFEPILLFFGPPLYGFAANVAYTAGPIVDTIAYRGSPRRCLLLCGYLFSILLTALPGAWGIAFWIWSLASGKRLI